MRLFPVFPPFVTVSFDILLQSVSRAIARHVFTTAASKLSETSSNLGQNLKTNLG